MNRYNQQRGVNQFEIQQRSQQDNQQTLGFNFLNIKATDLLHPLCSAATCFGLVVAGSRVHEHEVTAPSCLPFPPV